MMVVFIKEKSLLARIAARKLHSPNAAIVVKNTVYLWGVSRDHFLQSPAWTRHEAAHVYQYKKHGLIKFLWLYVKETLNNGYYNNRFEQEARHCESDTNILDGITFR